MSQGQPPGALGRPRRLRGFVRPRRQPAAQTETGSKVYLDGPPYGGMVGERYKGQLRAVGDKRATYQWTRIEGGLPYGLNMDETGMISGKPEMAELAKFTVEYTDAHGKKSGPHEMSLTINPRLKITVDVSRRSDLPRLDKDFIADLHAEGGVPTYKWKLTCGAALPPGLDLSPGGRIYGNPRGAGKTQFTVQVEDHSSRTTTANFLVKISRRWRPLRRRTKVTACSITVRASWLDRLFHVGSWLAFLAIGLPTSGAIWITAYAFSTPGHHLNYWGVGMLTALTAFLVGCLAGFLFGIPRTVSSPELRGSAATSAWRRAVRSAGLRPWSKCSGAAGHRPCGGADFDWRRQCCAAVLAQGGTVLMVQGGHVSPGWPHAEGEGLPPFLERGMLNLDGECRGAGNTELRLPEQLRQMTLAGPGQAGLVLGPGIEFADRLPEGRQRATAAGVIPHARRDHPARPRHPAHLPQARHGAGHEMHHQLGHGDVERAIAEGQLLGCGQPDICPRAACTGRGSKWLRRVHCTYGIGAQPAHELSRQRPGAASDIEGALAAPDAGQVGERGRERLGIAPHELQVGIGADVERHSTKPTASAATKHGSPTRSPVRYGRRPSRRVA